MSLRNVTITLEEDVARWVRIRAAEEDTSVARLVGRLVKERMTAEDRYRLAMREHFAQKPAALKKRGRYPTRDEVHER